MSFPNVRRDTRQRTLRHATAFSKPPNGGYRNDNVGSWPLSDLPARPLLDRDRGLSGHQPKSCAAPIYEYTPYAKVVLDPTMLQNLTENPRSSADQSFERSNAACTRRPRRSGRA
jgi:hypothetical protein